MSNITKTQKNLAVVFSIAMILTIGALAPNLSTVAYASSWSDWKDKFNGGNGDSGNSIEQSIEQSQESEQESQVVSGGDTTDSGNNVNVQAQNNEGDNVAGQSN